MESSESKFGHNGAATLRRNRVITPYVPRWAPGRAQCHLEGQEILQKGPDEDFWDLSGSVVPSTASIPTWVLSRSQHRDGLETALGRWGHSIGPIVTKPIVACGSQCAACRYVAKGSWASWPPTGTVYAYPDAGKASRTLVTTSDLTPQIRRRQPRFGIGGGPSAPKSYCEAASRARRVNHSQVLCVPRPSPLRDAT